MTPATTLHTLAPGDIDLFRAMLALFGEAFEDQETYTGQQPDDAYIQGLLADRHFIALVACSGTEVIGGLAGYVVPKFEQARSEFYIYDLAVADAHRRRGVATALIEALKVLCAQRGVYVIFVQADHGDDPAVALYTKLGTREDVMHFYIIPPAPPSAPPLPPPPPDH
ncbi:MAG: AAC(3)-I family aminoglycoside N-acetyltransferase [Hydrogenophaga sp.]